jgi:hypothetical protein
MVATLLAAGKSDALKQEIEKYDPRIEVQIMQSAVDDQRT